MQLTGDNCKMIPEPVQMPCSESCGAQSAQFCRGDSVHLSLYGENTILRLFNLAKKAIVSTMVLVEHAKCGHWYKSGWNTGFCIQGLIQWWCGQFWS